MKKKMLMLTVGLGLTVAASLSAMPPSYMACNLCASTTELQICQCPFSSQLSTCYGGAWQNDC